MPARRHKLHFGPYRTPRFRLGQHVEDQRRGRVRIVAISDGRIAWPIAAGPGGLSLVLFGGLAGAVRRESAAAVCYSFGVGPIAVRKWRRALDVPRWNEGDLLLKAANGRANKVALAAMHATAQDPGRRAKIAAVKRGKSRPAHVKAALRKANLGGRATATTRAKMSATHKARGTRPPWLNRPWSPAEDALARKLPLAEAARRTGRTYGAVASRRSLLRIVDSRGVPDNGN
jgi:hypothetical protein